MGRLLAVLCAASALLAVASAALAAPDAYRVTFVEKRLERTFDGELAESGTRTYALDVRHRNVTRFDAVLSWVETGDAAGLSAEDTFRLDVRTPAGTSPEASPGEGNGGVLLVRSGEVNEVPLADETDTIELPPATDEGTGTWRVSVTLLSTGNPPGSKVDKGNAYVLSVVVRWYEAEVLRVVGLSAPQTLRAASATSAWEWATYGLGAASALLGALLVVNGKRK